MLNLYSFASSYCFLWCLILAVFAGGLHVGETETDTHISNVVSNSESPIKVCRVQ